MAWTVELSPAQSGLVAEYQNKRIRILLFPDCIRFKDLHHILQTGNWSRINGSVTNSSSIIARTQSLSEGMMPSTVDPALLTKVESSFLHYNGSHPGWLRSLTYITALYNSLRSADEALKKNRSKRHTIKSIGDRNNASMLINTILFSLKSWSLLRQIFQFIQWFFDYRRSHWLLQYALPRHIPHAFIRCFLNLLSIWELLYQLLIFELKMSR